MSNTYKYKVYLAILSAFMLVPNSFANQNTNTKLAPVEEKGLIQANQPILVIRFNNGDVDFTNSTKIMVEEALNINSNITFKIITNIKSVGNKLQDAKEQNLVLEATRRLESIMFEQGVLEDKIMLEIREDSSANTSEIKIYPIM